MKDEHYTGVLIGGVIMLIIGGIMGDVGSSILFMTGTALGMFIQEFLQNE